MLHNYPHNISNPHAQTHCPLRAVSEQQRVGDRPLTWTAAWGLMYFLSLPSNREKSRCSSRTNLTHCGYCGRGRGGEGEGPLGGGAAWDNRKGRGRMGGNRWDTDLYDPVGQRRRAVGQDGLPEHRNVEQ